MDDSSIAVESPPIVETQPASGGHESFNFTDPGHSIREGIRRLESAHEAFASRFERGLSDSYGFPIRLVLQGIEQSTFDRYLTDLPTPGILAVLSLDPLPGTAIFELSAGAGLPLVEGMLGGKADASFDRKPTDIERKLLQGVVEDAVAALSDALGALGLGIAVENWHADPQFMGGASGELVILVRYGLSIGDGAEPYDRLVLSYPLAALQAIAEGKLEREPSTAEGGSVSAAPAWLGDHLPDVPVPFIVRLQASSVAFADVATLEPGDVLRLDHVIDDPVVGLVGTLPLLTGRLGMSTHKLAMEIAGWIDND